MIINNADPIKTRWQKVSQHIEKLQQQAGRPPAALIAVSKTQTSEAIVELLKAGQRDFGENRVQEAASKWPDLIKAYPDTRLHLIGSLQTNKVKEALALFNAIHTIDRESLIDAIIKERCEDSRTGEFFIQVNTGEEPQKGGVAPVALGALLKYAAEKNLPITGLMCVPPADASPAPHFALLYKYAKEAGLKNLSMGMSGDYETALRLGATHLRIGTLLFGERA